MSMTENEAIKWQESFKKTYNGFPPEAEEACDMAIKALEEIQQYREIGTIEEFKALKDKSVTKKVKGISLTYESRVGNCPNCNQFVVEKYDKRCPKCRLELDWEGGE
jgi:hypothetical protein